MRAPTVSDRLLCRWLHRLRTHPPRAWASGLRDCEPVSSADVKHSVYGNLLIAIEDAYGLFVALSLLKRIFPILSAFYISTFFVFFFKQSSEPFSLVRVLLSNIATLFIWISPASLWQHLALRSTCAINPSGLFLDP